MLYIVRSICGYLGAASHILLIAAADEAAAIIIIGIHCIFYSDFCFSSFVFPLPLPPPSSEHNNAQQ